MDRASSSQMVVPSASVAAHGCSRAHFYERKVVRDLLWTFSSPHMITDACFPVLPTHFGDGLGAAHHHPRVVTWLAALERDPLHLVDFLQQTTRSKGKMLALGVYFAALLEYWLRFCPLFRVERFALSKQIVSATNQTVGQLKFLFRLAVADDDNAAVGATEPPSAADFHVEASVKFFLLHPLDQRFQTSNDDEDQDGADKSISNGQADGDDSSSTGSTYIYQLEQFVGPHLGENLAWRVQEVARKLDMCKGESVQSWLREHYSDSVKSHIVLRGYLFYPLRQFASTSEVTQRHDWEFHANPVHADADVDSAESPRACHPSIAPEHLRGWWTSDIEVEFQAKTLANDKEKLGESRFIVLPKLHWLSPIIAVEDSETSEITIDGEKTLGIDKLKLMSLAELVAHAKHHFHVVAALPESQANGAVVMPLLISELVCCRPGDLEFDSEGKKKRWRELSRGFALDPQYWDPLPLCHDAVRFRRVANGKSDMLGEREYEGRRDWIHDGVVKPSDEEIAKKLKSEQHAFPDPAAMSPVDVCEELLALLAKDQKKFTHANLKKSISAVFQCQGDKVAASPSPSTHPDPKELSEPNLVATAEFVLQCVEYLVLGGRKHDVKVAQRVGHLILDAFEAQKDLAVIEFSVDKLPWQRFFLKVVTHKERWSYLFLTLRASDLICVLSCSGWEMNAMDQVGVVIEDLLSHQNQRWNAIAVETMKVFRLRGRLSGDAGRSRQQAHAVFETLMEQEDWKSAEQLAIYSDDLKLLQITFQRFSLLNMPKVLKRLRKVLCEYHATEDFAFDSHGELNGAAGSSGIHAHMGSPIDHRVNRSLTEGVVTPLAWEFVDSVPQLDAVVDLLESLSELIRSSSPSTDNPLETMSRMIVGIDCEWRPQFLSHSATELQNEAKARAQRSEERRQAAADSAEADDDEEPAEVTNESDGISVYQLAVGDNVFVVDVQVLGEAAARPLRFIWEHASSFAMVGFCVTSDLKRMTHSFPGLLDPSVEQTTKLLVELKQFAMYRQLPASKWGLSQLSRVCLDDEVEKEQQCSDWGIRPLSPSQLAYAAKDAFAVRNVALHLLADVQLASSSQVIEYLRHFAVVTGPTAASFGHWVSVVQPLSQEHVRSALRDRYLENVTSFHRLEKDADWDGSARTNDGLVVKTIAVLIRSSSLTRIETKVQERRNAVQYAAVVVRLDWSVDMQALGTVFGVDRVELNLADKE
ncbi:Calcineurin-like phosphoesterase, partial [Globisporangium polare]